MHYYSSLFLVLITQEPSIFCFIQQTFNFVNKNLNHCEMELFS
ncbi:hypothetical protein MtrunA17_Chr3g0127691 [Medicago truncatula]|uniref:Uncharacterized protein n=1 Tax=Medicago truncatula TaxID=3880 RepID=A0A396J021_MEDTR|nr:hypothetical protein MtrunA17_Chr3g0127691 [Medicago truncatula]